MGRSLWFFPLQETARAAVSVGVWWEVGQGQEGNGTPAACHPTEKGKEGGGVGRLV